MLAYETTKEEDAVEKYFCEPLSKKKQFEMSKDLTDFFITFSTSTEENVDADKARKTVWQFQAIEKRMSVLLNYTADNRVKLFILILTDGTIGKIVMYLHYMQYLCKKHNVKHITWDIFAMKFFPDGFFSDEDLHSVWDGQKVSKTSATQSGTDNLLDYQTASKSILL